MSSGEKSETVEFDEVLIAEHHAINARRKKLNRPLITGIPQADAASDPDKNKRAAYPTSRMFDAVGLAFSGGGIRSAAICLGAAQSLADKEMFDKIDYLSTVSGGGYTGTAITCCMNKDGQFPFRDIHTRADPPALGHIRNNSNYLLPTGLWDVVWNTAIYLRGVVASALFVVPVLLLLASLTLFINPTYISLLRPGYEGWPGLNHWLVSDGAFGVTLTVLAIVGFQFCVWAVVRAFCEHASEFSGIMYKLSAFGLVAIGVSAFCEFQPLVVRWLPPGDSGSTFGLSNLVSNAAGYFGVYLAPIVAAVSFASKYLGDSLKTEKTEKTWRVWMQRLASKLVVWIAALSLPLLLWIAYLNLVYWGVMPDANIEPDRAPSLVKRAVGIVDVLGITGHPKYAIAYLLIAILLLLLWLMQTPNANSLHRLYRDRLSKAFCFEMNGEKIMANDGLLLSKINSENTPYHLLNAALNLQGSEEVNKRGRNADFFVLSPLFSGSQATKYCRTAELEAVDKTLNIATAMAVSGAAISSNMGSESIKVLTPTLALMNFRLGYWTRNPREAGAKKVMPKNFALLSEAFGFLDECSSHIYLTDGGHIENLGVYELLRRRCRIIIAIDGEADPELNFPAFVKLQRHARIDLGIRITMKWDQIRSASTEVQKDGKGRSSGPHCAIGRIDYSEKDKGILLYVKSSVTGDENDYISDYNRRFEPFPHENTGDQFFSEEQFEVYRALGFHMVKGLFLGDQRVQTLKPRTPDQADPETVLQFLDHNAAGFGIPELREFLGLTPAAKKVQAKKGPKP
jgi:hypothetical protein